MAKEEKKWWEKVLEILNTFIITPIVTAVKWLGKTIYKFILKPSAGLLWVTGILVAAHEVGYVLPKAVYGLIVVFALILAILNKFATNLNK